MNNFKYIIVALLLIPFASCETAVDLDLKSAKPRLVIDASMNASTPCNVQLSMTKDYWDQDEVPKGVSGATITIENSKGEKETLSELNSNGFYISKMEGKMGETYTLTVEVAGEVYTAIETLPEVVPIEGIRAYKVDTGGDLYFYPSVWFKDPVDVQNYYLYILSINNRTMQEVRFDDDKNWDGKDREQILFFDDKENNSEELKVGDRVFVEMQSISKGAYNFYNTKSSPGGTQNSNPVSNFSGDVLGMFKAYSSSTIEMTIAEEDLQ